MGACISRLCLNSKHSRTVFAAALLLGAGVCRAQEPAPASDGGTKVTAVRYWSLGDLTRVAIEVSGNFSFKFNRLSDPDRLFFDIAGARPAMVRRGIHTIPVEDPFIRQIRVAENEPGVTRVVLDLSQAAVISQSQLNNPSRLIVELRSQDKAASTSVPGTPDAARTSIASLESKRMEEAEAAVLAPVRATTASTVSKEARRFVPPARRKNIPRLETIAAPSIKLTPRTLVLAGVPGTFPKDLPPPQENAPVRAALSEPPAAVAPSALAKLAPAVSSPRREPNSAPVVSNNPNPGKEALPAKRGTISGERSLTRALGLKLERVVLDPGHGGHDQGTHGPSGYTEKELSLDVARRLGALIEARMGSEVIYTRTDDSYVALEERTRTANEHKADLFLSIHANSSPYRSAAGVETYVLNFTTSKTAMDLAARENASSQRSIYDLQELLQKIALRDKIGESLEFATRLQSSLSSLSTRVNDNAKNRGIKRAPFVVLIGANMPSVLAEIGFLTNPSDETLLKTPEHRQKIAEALYKGIASYADTLSRFQVARRD
jgi:N-acetylmuramoyl-L-alanine amidase